mgnify:CR=1 FL=1|tara:strand:+ start:13190 stop:16348 length:3159 start_codon:yes stop_codon:yes gene_type:complete
MPIEITNESYNGMPSLQANAGDWVEATVDFAVRFSVGSGVSNKIIYDEFAGQYRLTLQTGDFGSQGFLAGDVINLIYQLYPFSPAVSQNFQCTVLYVSGNEMYIDQAFGLNPSFGSTWTHVTGRQFPTDNYCSGLLVLADREPSSVEFHFNLTPNGSFIFNSLIDSEINRFELPVVTGIPIGIPESMTQLTNLSGGLIKDTTITLISSTGSGWRNYRISYKFFQWGIIQDGIEPPSYYATTDCVAPIALVKCFAEYGNPNGVQESQTENVESNTGFFDENFNGGLNLYTAETITWTDFLGDTIDKLDYSNTCQFTARINAPNQVNPTSTFNIGLAWRPVNANYYQNKILTNVGENLLLLAPEVDFNADGVTDPTLYFGLTDENGARWDFRNLKFEMTDPTTLEVTGQIIPNAQATALFAGIPSGGRKSTLWISIGDISLDGTNLSKRVSLRLFDEDNFDAPTLGVQIPNVIDEVLLDHNGNDITLPLPQTTTEDDVLYRSNFQLIQGKSYEGVRARIHAYNTVTEDSFTLEDIFFSFASVPEISGVFQPNFVNPRGFNLPPTSDRNHISLVRNPFIDAGALYGITLEYGYLSRWEYWLSQPNVDNDFFNITENFDGKNKNWQRFSNSGDWVVRLSYYVRFDGVDDFNNQEVGIRNYEDNIDVSTTWAIERLSDGTFPTNLVNNEIHEVTALLTWAGGNYVNSWAEITIEDYESGNRWVISSVLAHGGISSNPLQPITGLTVLDLTLPASNVAQLKTLIDTNVVSANKVCVSARIYSESAPDYPIQESMEAEFGYSLRKISGREIYADDAPCVRVRRSSDNVEMDIGFSGDPLVMDETALLDFVNKGGTEPNNDGWLTTWYDQSGWNRDAVQTIASNQCRLVASGIVDKENGRATVNTRPGGVTKKGLVIPTLVTIKTLFTVAKVEVVTSRNFLLSTGGFNGWFQGGNTTGLFENFGAYDGVGNSWITSNLNQNIGYMNLRDLRIFLALNGDVETNVGAFGAEITSNVYLLGSNLYGNLVLNGNAQELIGFNVDFSGQRAFIGGNQNTFYTVY